MDHHILACLRFHLVPFRRGHYFACTVQLVGTSDAFSGQILTTCTPVRSFYSAFFGVKRVDTPPIRSQEVDQTQRYTFKLEIANCQIMYIVHCTYEEEKIGMRFQMPYCQNSVLLSGWVCMIWMEQGMGYLLAPL